MLFQTINASKHKNIDLLNNHFKWISHFGCRPCRSAIILQHRTICSLLLIRSANALSAHEVYYRLPIDHSVNARDDFEFYSCPSLIYSTKALSEVNISFHLSIKFLVDKLHVWQSIYLNLIKKIFNNSIIGPNRVYMNKGNNSWFQIKSKTLPLMLYVKFCLYCEIFRTSFTTEIAALKMQKSFMLKHDYCQSYKNLHHKHRLQKLNLKILCFFWNLQICRRWKY